MINHQFLIFTLFNEQNKNQKYKIHHPDCSKVHIFTKKLQNHHILLWFSQTTKSTKTPRVWSAQQLLTDWGVGRSKTEGAPVHWLYTSTLLLLYNDNV